MIIFATSDKGGTGRSVTSANVMYRRALLGDDCAYLDFDFRSPTSGSIFYAGEAQRGVTTGDGLHSYFKNAAPQPRKIDLWQNSKRPVLQNRPGNAGRLTLVPGDEGGSDFALHQDMHQRCVSLLLNMRDQFEFILVDLSAGRSYALELALIATAKPELRGVPMRWLVFHRWTRQHILAAAGLVDGKRGILDIGTRAGWDRDDLRSRISFVHTAVIDPTPEATTGSPQALTDTQINFLSNSNHELLALAANLDIGHTRTLGEVPLDPVLQWEEQLISDHDVHIRGIANAKTVESFENLATRLGDS